MITEYALEGGQSSECFLEGILNHFIVISQSEAYGDVEEVEEGLPYPEVSTSTMKGKSGSWMQRVGAEEKVFFSWVDSGFQDRDLDRWLIMEVSGEALVLKLEIKRR